MINNVFLPVGIVLPYAGPLADTDSSATNLAQIRANLASTGWLFCDGSSLPTQDYALLYGVIGNAFGGSGSNFNLPDLRGQFIRGVNGGAQTDPDADSRTAGANGGNSGDKVGSQQNDAFQGHEHNYVNMIEGPNPLMTGEGLLPYIPDPVPATTTSMQEKSPDGTPRTASETRPVNVYMNYIIRFC